MFSQNNLQVALQVIAISLIFLGLFGLVYSTVGAPWLAMLFAFKRPVSSDKPLKLAAPSSPPLRIELLVAAFNEEKVLRQTLEGLKAAARTLQKAQGDQVEILISVGLDHCTDRSNEIVQECGTASDVTLHAIQNMGTRGKWNTLLMLIGQSSADWIALVDGGALWHPELLVAAWPSMINPDIMGIAPSYAPAKGGRLERSFWRFEGFLKGLENAAGGPVTVYGPSVFYRRSILLGALAHLHGTSWINDDVVIPLTLRLQNPTLKMYFLKDSQNSKCREGSGWVKDLGIVSDVEVEYRRRRRIIIGNFQWIRQILLPQLSVVLLASRRAFRVFWAYWILLILFGSGVEFALALRNVSGTREITRALLMELGLIVGVSVALGGLLFSNWIRRLGMAFINGLFVTRYWKELSSQKDVSWT